MARLVLSLDSQVMAEYNMNKERYTIGRLPDNDIRIDNAAVSGHHSLIINFLNDSFLEDLNSTNGTYVNGMLLDQLAVDVGAIGAVQILEERVVEDVDDQRVMTADGSVVNADVVVREPPDGVALLVHVVFRHHLAIQAQDQPCHVLLTSRVSAEPTQDLVEYLSASRERIHDVRHHHRDVVPASIVIGQLDQLLGDRVKISTKGDRKSTRLNSSHDQISYAVFCLKKKKIIKIAVINKKYTEQSC